MAITDELREYAEIVPRLTSDLTAIADRIDAEHEKQMAEQRRSCVFYDAERNYCKVHDEGDMAELGYVRLPVDADGVPIRVGDVVEWVPYDNTYPSVVRKVNAVGNGVFFAWDKANGRFAQYEAHAYRHHKQQTVEDVLRELEGMRGNGADYEDVVTRCAELAKTLRELLAVSANE